MVPSHGWHLGEGSLKARAHVAHCDDKVYLCHHHLRVSPCGLFSHILSSGVAYFLHSNAELSEVQKWKLLDVCEALAQSWQGITSCLLGVKHSCQMQGEGKQTTLLKGDSGREFAALFNPRQCLTRRDHFFLAILPSEKVGLVFTMALDQVKPQRKGFVR